MLQQHVEENALVIIAAPLHRHLDLDFFPGLERDDFDARCLLAELVGRAREQREGAVVARDAALAAEQLERDASLARVHREVPADR